MYLLASQTVALCQGEGTKHSDTTLKSYIRKTLRSRRAGKRLYKSKRLVHPQLPPSATSASCPVPIKLRFIIRLHPSISVPLTLPTTRPAHFKPTADLQVISGLASNKETYLKGTGRSQVHHTWVTDTACMGSKCVRSRVPKITPTHYLM